MKVIEIFNRKLNQSLTYENEELKAFRLQVDEILKSVHEQLFESKTSIIIGAGKMKDFFLTFFVNNFNSVILTDIDIQTVNEEIKNLNLTKKELEKIVKIRIDYSGFEKNLFFNNFKEKIINCHSYDKIDEVINKKLKGLENYKFLRAYYESADLVYISPIYTQIVYNQVLRECALLRENNYPEHMIKYIENIMLDKMVMIIDTINNNIVNTLKPTGQLVALSDIFQVDIGSDFYLKVKKGINDFKVMEEIYEEYKKKYGIGLGDYGLLNLDEKLKPDLSKWLIWPYDGKSSFVVKLKIYKKEINIKEEYL